MYIEINHLSKKIKGKTILDDLSLSIKKASIVGFVGHNGSGKTMLFRALAGFLKLGEGMVKIKDQAVNLNREYPVNIGLILENPQFIPQMTGLENLEYLASLRNEIGLNQIEEALEIMDLTEARDKKVKEYSLGMKQRLGIAQAFMEDQELLLLDEPTNGLDRGAYENFVRLAQQWKAQGRTVLLASHDAYLMEDLADFIYELADGRLVAAYENQK